MTKRKKFKDPNAAQEAKRYEHPIPSRVSLLNYFEEVGEPLSYEDLLEATKLETPEQADALMYRLKAMIRDGQLMRMRSGLFGVIDKLSLLKGRVQAHPDGHGFLIPEDSNDKAGDMFIGPRQMQQVFHGDLVLGRITREFPHRNRREGVIVRVLERKYTHVVGQYFEESGAGFVVPDNKRITQDIVIPQNERNDVKNGEIVKVEILSYPTFHSQAVGRVVEILGEHMAAGMETDMAVRSHGLPYEWPKEIEAELKKFKDKVQKKDLKDRIDLRDLPFVTIDGDDARDFDDAVYCYKRKSGGWVLYVAIADVSHYVKPGSALDKEAFERGNSAYFPSRVIPMLPEKLSNGLCSLNPEVDRLVMVCEMKITQAGKTSRSQFYPAVIHSKARLTYDQVAKMICEENKKLQKQFAHVFAEVQELFALYEALLSHRREKGAIDFELSEPKVIFDKDKKIKNLIPLVRNDAHRLIEECMLAANVATAKFLLKHKSKALYRVHPAPKAEKIRDLSGFLNPLGLKLNKTDELSPKDYADLLKQIEDRPDKHVIQMLLLRSMMQADYQVKNQGHFGLGFDAYTHFTSPIRRYPDLIVHRAIKHVLEAKKLTKQEIETIDAAAAHCSMTERRADEASRDVMSWLKCEFMMDKVGQEFDGVINTVTSFGLFVELQEIYVEGLVHISRLQNDYYEFDMVRHRLIGESSGQVYAMGDAVRIRVDQVDLDQRRIDFSLLTKKKKSTKTKKKKKTTPKKQLKAKKAAGKPAKKKVAKKKATKKKNSKKA
jgi:ribonuclease R